MDVTAEFYAFVAWPRMWLMGAKIRLALEVAANRETVVNEFSDQFWALVQCSRHHRHGESFC